MSSASELWKQVSAFARDLGLDMNKLDLSTLLLLFGIRPDGDPRSTRASYSEQGSHGFANTSSGGRSGNKRETDNEDDGDPEEYDEEELRGILAAQSSIELPSTFDDEDDELDDVYQASASSSKSPSSMRASLVRGIQKRFSKRTFRRTRASPSQSAATNQGNDGAADADGEEDTASDALNAYDEAYLSAMLDSITPKQALAVEMLRTKFIDATCEEIEANKGFFKLNDATFLRFLQSKDYNVRRAADALYKHLDWRDVLAPASLRAHDVRNALATGLVRRAHVTKDGHPIILVDIGNLDVKLFAGEGMELFVRLCAFVFEQSVREMPAGLYENVMVLDAGNFSYRDQAGKTAMEVLKSLISILQNDYPALIKKIYLVNSPSMATIAWNAVRFVLSRDLKSRISFVRRNEQMREIVDPDMLMVSQGGDKTTPFPIHGIDAPVPGEDASTL
ncbi:SEC14-like protein 2 [Hondaea fermentalgiana]|uniref:SEC14-like protein 2 n=1 Tax=Hondaea fermentalgiana TaxID=2315210 RepID=A0A2R5G2M6_9STRA|nr:SEC14-like protein 2 [Hondaea fermentalgiana]|eukprot:GBG25277.1 SEC14-like protein 2 [Hondaea fermentalgiana]